MPLSVWKINRETWQYFSAADDSNDAPGMEFIKNIILRWENLMSLISLFAYTNRLIACAIYVSPWCYIKYDYRHFLQRR